MLFEEAFEQINQSRHIHLAEISEIPHNSLRLTIEKAGATGKAEDLWIGDVKISDSREILPLGTSYEFVFEQYIAYSIRNESYTVMDSDEKWQGLLFCIYSESHFLNYVRMSTFACDEYPGPSTHYSFNCLDHIVDVVSTDPPIIRCFDASREL